VRSDGCLHSPQKLGTRFVVTQQELAGVVPPACHAMLCYAMLCYAMLCYAMLCYAMLCYAMLCYAMHAWC
jgi:hypothetical protein